MSSAALALLGLLPPTAYLATVAAWHAHAHRRYQQVTGSSGPPAHVHAAEWRRKWRLRRWQALGALPTPTHLDGRRVVLVHGFLARAAFWRGLQLSLHHRGRPTTAVELGWPLGGVDSYVPALRDAVQGDPPVDVVTHSMGGLVLRATLRDHPPLRPMVRSVITLGTPHHGTEAARGLPAHLPRDLGDLQPDSPYLQALPPLPELLPHAQRHAVAAVHDIVAFPPERVLPPGMQHHVLHALGHNGLLTEPRVHHLIGSLLHDASLG